METPPPEPVRRSTRNALTEIPTRMGALQLTTLDNTPVRGPLNNNNGNVLGGLLDMNNMNISGSYMTPKPSPDELVIQARGRRKSMVTWSPDIDNRHHPSRECTPVKHQRSSIVLRSTPTRKRLLLNDSADSPSPKKLDSRSMSPYKKFKLEGTEPTLYGPLDTSMRALSQDQLITIIQTIICKHPYLEQEVKSNLPAPDLKPLEEKLHDLKRNIFKSLPTSRLTSKTDSPAFNRASTHVSAFKKCVQEQGRTLVSSQQWDVVCDYVLLAWRYVSSTPVWDNPPHNSARKQCFKFLAAQCIIALKKVNWSLDQCKSYHNKLESLAQDSEDIQACLKQIESMKMKLLN